LKKVSYSLLYDTNLFHREKIVSGFDPLLKGILSIYMIINVTNEKTSSHKMGYGYGLEKGTWVSDY